MTEIRTERLIIKPTHKNCWSIFDQLNEQLIGKLFFRNQWFNILLKPQSLRLGVATEASYGLLKAINSDAYKAKTDLPHAQQFLMAMGFKQHNSHFQVAANELTCPDLYRSINHKLGIDTQSLAQPKHATSTQLVDTSPDCFGRPAKLHPAAAEAWQNMQLAAQQDGIELQLVSAFRSLSYQANLIHQKLQQGQALADILQTNAAPGHSEHHSGCAVDISTAEQTPLQEAFEQTPAFNWLQKQAKEHGFTMSYPRDNPHGIIYEPWHWCFHHKPALA